jgi:elongation factor Ts
VAAVDAAQVKALRQKTNAGVMECKKALEECGGDLAKAAEVLREQGLAIAEKKQSRVARFGLVDAYIHAGGRIGVLLELNCESDFVARTDQFKTLAHDICLQIAAIGPKYVSAEDKPADDESETAAVCLMEQPFIKDPGQSIQQLIVNTIAQVGENIRVKRFTRYELGGQ